MNAVNDDYCAVSAYGAGRYVEDIAEPACAALLDNIYPGGLISFSNKGPKLAQIKNQVSIVKKKVGNIYVPGGKCDMKKSSLFRH